MVKLKKVHFAFDELDGLIKFRNDTINLENLFVRSGKSDLRVTGMAHNLFNSIFNDTTGLKMNINFVSNNFYFNDFNSSATKSKKEISKTKKAPSTIDVVDGNRFHLPYGIEASMSGIVKNFYAKNFHGQNIELKMDLTNQKVSFIETMNSFGGKLSFKTEFTPVNSKIHCKSNINMKNFHIDKVFSAFNDFKQSILTSKNVKGVVSGKVYSFFKMNSNLAVDTNSIYVKGDYSIRKFELMNVEPIMKLEKVGFEENDLKRVTFENINSTIEFSKNELTIPRTLFVSNILYFYLDVKVKDDGESVINILLPIKNMKKKPQTDGLTNDSKAGLSIPIKIVGKSGKLKVL